jgi:hypothetical protein
MKGMVSSICDHLRKSADKDFLGHSCGGVFDRFRRPEASIVVPGVDTSNAASRVAKLL